MFLIFTASFAVCATLAVIFGISGVALFIFTGHWAWGVALCVIALPLGYFAFTSYMLRKADEIENDETRYAEDLARLN